MHKLQPEPSRVEQTLPSSHAAGHDEGGPCYGVSVPSLEGGEVFSEVFPRAPFRLSLPWGRTVKIDGPVAPGGWTLFPTGLGAAVVGSSWACVPGQ